MLSIIKYSDHKSHIVWIHISMDADIVFYILDCANQLKIILRWKLLQTHYCIIIVQFIFFVSNTMITWQIWSISAIFNAFLFCGRVWFFCFHFSFSFFFPSWFLAFFWNPLLLSLIFYTVTIKAIQYCNRGIQYAHTNCCFQN